LYSDKLSGVDAGALSRSESLGWTIYFRIRTDRPWSEDDLRKLRVHAGKWSAKLSRSAEGYNLSTLPESADWRGSLKPSPDARGASDYLTVVQALSELEQLFGARATVWDDYYLSDPTAPAEVDTAALSERIREEYERADSEDDTPSEAGARPLPPGEDDEQQHVLAQVKSKLEQARADFEIWKRAQEKKKG
jgi:hypothetical protein